MTALERITATLNRRKPDRVPVIPQVFGHAALLAGVPLGDYVCDGEVLARCQLEALAYYGHDAVFALMDVGVETEALGSELEYRREAYPVVARYALDADPRNLPALDPHAAGRMPEILKAVRILRREAGTEVPVVGCVLGPLSLVVQLLGPEAALYLAVDNEARFQELLGLAAETGRRFGTAQLEAGAHILMVFDPSASPDFIPPPMFREFELPLLRRLFDTGKSFGALAGWLHIAGPVEPILPYYREAGVDIANIDYCVDPIEARRIAPELCLNGNLKPLAFVTQSPAEIAASANRLLELFQDDHGFILSSGCEIPPEAEPETIRAMVTAVRG